ncbi:MAG: NAD(+) synthase [Alphaproteobacteria bacterium]
MRRRIRRAASAVPAIMLGLALAAPAAAGAQSAYETADAALVCGFLPYRSDGADRFAGPRAAPESAATIGPQATYPLAWDLARPSFLAAEIADALLAGQSAEAVRATQGAALSLGEYMLHAAADLAAEPSAPATDDMRLRLAAERPRTFHRLYVRAKADHEAVVAHVTPGAAPAQPLSALSAAWRPAYALLAKAQADDKRIELLATGLDAAAVAEMLGVQYESISIGPAMEAFTSMLAGAFEGAESDVTEENIQSRSRGLTLMAISNKFGYMVLTTGNKSEMAVGYATLYGDMCGGYNAIKDIYKTTVFDLCRWRNDHAPTDVLGPAGAVMPERVIAKPPSAELRPDQKDEDSLPPYDTLDAILERMFEDEQSLSEIVEAGYDEETVRRVWRLLDTSEYKRFQAPPGAKISRKNFGKGRRYPMTNGYRRLI